MTPTEQIDALLNLVDPDRTPDLKQGQRLKVLGLAVTRGKGFWPSQAGWNLLGDRGRAFDVN